MNWRIVYVKSKGRQGCHSCRLNKVNNFKIFRIFNEKFIFLYELCKRVHNTFIVKLGSLALLHFRPPPPPIVIDDSSWKNAAESFTIALTLTLGGVRKCNSTGSFTVYFKIMPFWGTYWPFKKVPYNAALTYNYGMSEDSDDVSAIHGPFILINRTVWEELVQIHVNNHLVLNFLWQVSHLMSTFSPLQIIKCLFKA